MSTSEQDITLDVNGSERHLRLTQNVTLGASGVTYAELLRTHGPLEATASPKPDENKDVHVQSFGSQVAEVRVDEELGRVRVSRYAGVFDCGRIVNHKTARSQMLGGIAYGIGMELLEETGETQRRAGP